MRVGPSRLWWASVTKIYSALTERAGELRLAFDRSFAQVASRAAASTEDLLAIRVGSAPYAIRLSEITGLFAGRKITRLPGGVAPLLGIAGFRGVILPVYDLHVLLGFPAVAAPRWLAIVSNAALAVAFETLEGHIRALSDALVPRESDENTTGQFVREFLSMQDISWPIAPLVAIAATITRRATESTRREER